VTGIKNGTCVFSVLRWQRRCHAVTKVVLQYATLSLPCEKHLAHPLDPIFR
jgi:hypothetical protein